MDFVAKHAFQNKVKKFGEELGVKQLFSEQGSSSNRANEGSVFDIGSSGDFEGDDTSIPASVQAYYESQPNNFPGGPLKLFYADRGILDSQRAQGCVTWAFRLLLSIELLLLINIVNRLLSTLFDSSFSWVYILVAVLVAIILTVLQLYAYEVAFRGAYQSKAKLRLRYLIISAGTIVVAGLYNVKGICCEPHGHHRSAAAPFDWLRCQR